MKYLTVYAFSTENWNRPKDEVDALMKLLRNYMKNCLKRASKNNMSVRVIGEKSRLDEDIRKSIEELEEATDDLDYNDEDDLEKIQKITIELAEKYAGKMTPEVQDILDAKGLVNGLNDYNYLGDNEFIARHKRILELLEAEYQWIEYKRLLLD